MTETLFERTQQDLRRRKQNVLNGKINSIPTPFKRFKKYFTGLEQGCYTCITSFSKGGKTQFTSFLLFEALMYLIDYPEAFDLKVFYFHLEESDIRLLERFESYLLFKLDKIRISPKNLRSTDNDNPVPDEILDLLETEKYQIYIKAFEKHFILSTVSNPTGIYKICEKYAAEHGTIHTRQYVAKNEFGQDEVIEGAFDYYTPNNPNEFVFVVADHGSLISTEKGKSLKESLDLLSIYFVKLRNRFNYSPIMIQQQSSDNESNDSIKLKNIRPSGRGLSDSKYIQRDVNQLFGLFSPMKFDLKEYMGYDITKFKDHIRFFEVCNSRDDESGGLMALFFDGETCNFYSLPKPQDPEILKWYKYLDELELNKNKNGSNSSNTR